MKLARAIHFDESDSRVYASPARTGEWCISGGFEFSNFSEGDLTGKARQAFANGWFGLETGGRVTFVAVTLIEEAERETLAHLLANHFVTYYGAPDVDAAPAEVGPPLNIPCHRYAAMYGPTTGDRLQLGNTALVLEVRPPPLPLCDP